MHITKIFGAQMAFSWLIKIEAVTFELGLRAEGPFPLSPGFTSVVSASTETER